MSDLFSIFDPTTSGFPLPINWLAIFLITLTFPQKFWSVPSQVVVAIKSILLFVHNEFFTLLGPQSVPGLSWAGVSLIVFIMFNNCFGLVPYVFTASRHLRFTLRLALPLWVGHVLISWVIQPLPNLAHLVPLGTPYPLMPFIVIIELVRNVIRPGTLAVRLAANIVAGHLLLTLMGSLAPTLNMGLLLGLLAGLVALITLESAVALIQSYVFRVLITLYVEEMDSPKIRRVV